MSHVLKLILGWYFFLTVLALLGATTLSVKDIVPGLALMWVLFGFFCAGMFGRVVDAGGIFAASRINNRLYFFMSVASLACAAYAANFYTGKNVGDILGAATFKVSNYNDYQTYNSENELTSFTVNQVPAFFAILVFKFWMLFCFINILVGERKWSLLSVFFLSASAASQIYYSMARGTGFEYFELLFLVWYCFVLRSPSLRGGRSIGFAKIFVVVLSILFLFIFLKGFTSRYDSELLIECATTKICIDTGSFWFSVSDSLGLLTYTLSGYFTFGIYFMSVFVESLFGAGVADPVYYFVPLNVLVLDSIRVNLCGRFLDCGVAWVPDAISYVEYFGVPLFFLCVYGLGRLSFYFLMKAKRQFEFLHLAILYYCVLVMFSMPVGNFISASVPNLIILLSLLGLLQWKFFIKKRRFVL